MSIVLGALREDRELFTLTMKKRVDLNGQLGKHKPSTGHYALLSVYSKLNGPQRH